MVELILASTSPYRRELMARLGAPFAVEAPGVDEAPAKSRGAAPEAVVAELARAKARAVAARHPDAVVVGSDQAAVIDGDLLDKPGSEENAVAQLQRLRGREHRLLTAVAVAHPGGVTEFTETTRLTVRDLGDDEIARYVARERPLDCAGSYKVEALGITLFERIEGGDHTAIVGLPLIRLGAALRALGIALP